MKTPRHRILGYSWLGFVNILFFQWFFVRLQGEIDKATGDMKLGWLIGVVPLTGWWSDYIFLRAQ